MIGCELITDGAEGSLQPGATGHSAQTNFYLVINSSGAAP